MGKHGKKQSQQQRRGRKPFSYEEEEYEEERDFPLNPTQYPPSDADADAENKETRDEKVQGEAEKSDEYQLSSSNNELPSKFMLYQQSVQSPKGDISYLQKFFLMYVGGRAPLHLQEDFCGTALLSTEWLRSDARRTAVGLDMDVEALNWCLENNINKIGADVSSRISLFHGNVLEPTESILVNFDLQDLQQKIVLEDSDGSSATGLKSSCHNRLMKDTQLPARDIVCAFNYSCCCLHTRQELVSYFNHALKILNKKGGIFVMDLYGGTSSECELKLQRKFPNFTYTWEQAGFDIIQRKTRISLHFNLQKPNRKLRHAFSYSWRLWSLPEIKDCLEEAGFGSVHFWTRNMPNSEDMKSIDGFGAGRDIKYEEVTSFQQQDSWNAYVVGVV